MGWFMYLIMAYVLFYGSKRDASGTVIKFFGSTLYERRRNPELPAPPRTLALTDGKTDDDERDLWERLTDAGFPVIKQKENRDWRLTDIGAIKVIDGRRMQKCTECYGKTYWLGEIQRKHNHHPLVGRAMLYEIGCVCASCGSIAYTGPLHKEGSLPGPGKLSQHVSFGINFFDLLKYFERAEDDPATAAENAGLPFLERRRDQLEGELNEVRLAIKRKEAENGQGEPYRDSQKTPPDDPSPPTGSGMVS